MKTLFIWLMLYTSLDNETKTSNKEIKERFLREYPQYKESININLLGGKIGFYLNDIYPNLIKYGNGRALPMYYNVKLLSKPKGVIKLNWDTFLDVKLYDLSE